MPIINGQGRVAVRVTGGSPSPSSSYLLDTYGGAAAAYSLRKLSNTYSGSAIRVRRSSDNTEQNIGFDGSGNLDTSALTTFVGAGNGFVTTWYDQSGNGRNMTQTTANLQPTIVSAGSILLQSGKPKISLSGGKWFTSNTPYSPTTRRDAFFVTNNDGDTVFLYPDDYAGSSYAYGYVASNGDGSTNLYYNPDSTPSLYVNNTLQTVSTRAQVYTALNGYKLVNHENFRNIYSLFNLGRYSGYEYGGSFQEVIYYFSDQSSNRSGINSNINTYYSIYSPMDSDAQAFITAASITDSTQQSAVNTLVTSLKSAGIWSKMKAIYPFVGGTASSHKFNLKDPRDLDAAYRLVFNGGWTHSSTGALPNAANGYADTKLVPNTSLTLNNTHLSVYSRTNISRPSSWHGVSNTYLPIFAFQLSDGNSMYFDGYDYQNHRISATDTNSLGHYIGSINSSTNQVMYKNGVSKVVQSAPQTQTSLPSYSIFLSTRNDSGTPNPYYGGRELSFSSIGDGLTDAEASAFYTAVQAFQTTLGRQVA